MNIGGYKGHPFLKKKPEKREFKERENKGKQRIPIINAHINNQSKKVKKKA